MQRHGDVLLRVSRLRVSLACISWKQPTHFVGHCRVSFYGVVTVAESLPGTISKMLEETEAVLGIAFGVLFGRMILSRFIPQIAYALPVTMDNVAMMVVLGMPLPAMFVSQVIVMAVLGIVLFIVVTLWRIKRIEF